MKLKYRILWFEDDEEVVDDRVLPDLSNFLQSLGFQLEISHHMNGDNLEVLLKDRNYDLIVTDLNLGEDEHETGEQIIDEIRKGKILTEVLLYSANAQELNTVIEHKGWVERASFCVGLGNLPGKLSEIIELTIKKHQDVNNVRGLVIAETIDLETKIKKIFLDYFENPLGLDEEKKGLLTKIKDKKIEKHNSDIAEMLSLDLARVREFIDNDILTANNNLQAIQSILKDKIKAVSALIEVKNIQPEAKKILEEKRELLKLKKEELNKFTKEILHIRNTLAHVTEEAGEDGVPFLKSLHRDGAHLIFNGEKYTEIRKNLAKHNQNLDEILIHFDESKGKE